MYALCIFPFSDTGQIFLSCFYLCFITLTPTLTVFGRHIYSVTTVYFDVMEVFIFILISFSV